MARPTDFTTELADEICERLSGGESLRVICASETMPNRSTVFRWLTTYPQFCDQYRYAREGQAECLADEIVEISNGPDADEDTAVKAARDRLRVDARKWVASKLLPKKYGDRQVLAGDPEAPLHGMSDADLDAAIAAKLAELQVAK